MTDTPNLPLAGRVALVTGASRGIGRECAIALAQAGAHVIGVARTQGGLEVLDDKIRAVSGQAATLVPMDLAQGDGIDQLGLAIHERHGKLDILVHAAAVLGGLSPISHIDPPAWDKTVAINLTATYRLLRSTERLLKAAPAGRALIFTSGRVARPKAFWGAYGATKAATDHLVRTWADELENTSVRAALIDPGAMRTKMRAEAMPGEDPGSLPDPAEIGPMIVDLAQADLGQPDAPISFSAWKASKASSGH
ncbi:MAG: SDR family NAD(P)-dependent oxidoreductase [Phenylobacterium sp.]|uniref:SDR family NAD(P)-dependent oxidoreductase n=1 Tax=Phenylobacterium sp. TaxID=1871053 RepID=UPI0027358FF4|nr:SDR family NAD(P)-dependent oxidoreductase [Phenylobacterium sp.]MDP1641719.1 SDR family NAD(P)-dependent oxidoreductase [Phenylobacterium sp.]MDP3118401.1 SDR family NAD(P)-dependent oxidoreductase [Phenylobacterium sp.]MDP3384606.1 SDR family NAD(P)-dependent oxidoreductase [Phenylobacterium sp.]